MLNFQNNLLRPQPLKGRGPAEWRNMGGSSRAVIFVSNQKTRPPFLRSFPTAVPASQQSDAPDLSNRSPSCCTTPAVKEISPRVACCLPGTGVGGQALLWRRGARRRTTSGGRMFRGDRMARRRREGRREVVSGDGEDPWRLRPGSGAFSPRREPGRRR